MVALNVSPHTTSCAVCGLTLTEMLRWPPERWPGHNRQMSRFCEESTHESTICHAFSALRICNKPLL